jgi:hypothetical protein
MDATDTTGPAIVRLVLPAASREILKKTKTKEKTKKKTKKKK